MDKNWGQTNESEAAGQKKWNEDEAELSEYDGLVRTCAKNPQVAGAILLVAGGALAKFFVFDVLAKLREHAESSVSVHSALIFLPVILAEIGLIYLFGGRKGVLFMANKTGEGRQLRPAQTVVGLIMAATGLGFYFWFQNELSALGYR